MKKVLFQTKNIKPDRCEVGLISATDPEYIYYLDEPCKVKISEVTIIPDENAVYNKKQRCYFLKRK